MSGDSIRYGKRAPKFAPVPEWVLLSGVSPDAIALYAVLLAHVNHGLENGVAFPGMDTLAAILGFKQRKSVSRYLRELVAIGAVEVERKPHSTLRRNEYVVNELAPEAHAGPRSLIEYYDLRKTAGQAPTGTQVPLGRGTERPAATGTQRPQKERKGTRGSELEEVHASGEDAPAGAHEQARGRATTQQPRRIHIERPTAVGEKQRTQKLVAAATAAMKKAGRPLGSHGKSGLGQWLQTYAAEPVDDVASQLEDFLTAALAGDHPWLFHDLPKQPARANTIEALDQLHDDYDGVPGSAAIDRLAEQGYHPAAIEHIVRDTAQAMA